MDQSLQHVSPLRYIHTLEAVCYAITLEECMGYDTKVAQKSSGSTLISSKNGKKTDVPFSSQNYSAHTLTS